MEFSDTVKALIRRWYVLLLGLLITCGLGWAVFQEVPDTYRASATLLLMPSEATVGAETNPYRGNPYLSLSGMGEARDVLVRRADSAANRAMLLNGHNGSQYTLATDPTTQSPIILLEAQSPTPEMATSVLQAVVTDVDQNLNTMQSEQDVPQNQRIRIGVLVIDQQAIADSKAPKRAAIATVGAGMVGTFLAAGWVDGIMRRRNKGIGLHTRSEARRGLMSPSADMPKDDKDKTNDEHGKKRIENIPPSHGEPVHVGDDDLDSSHQASTPVAATSSSS